jgi:hypothetical protein
VDRGDHGVLGGSGLDAGAGPIGQTRLEAGQYTAMGKDRSRSGLNPRVPTLKSSPHAFGVVRNDR